MAAYDTVPDPIEAGEQLTVVIRDDGPMNYAGDSPAYRSVRIDLTPEQRAEIKLKATYFTTGAWHFESVSKCFIEPRKSN